MCYKIKYIVLGFLVLPVAEVARVSTYAKNRVHWTRFVSQETKFIGLGFLSIHVSIIACTQKNSSKLSSKNTQFSLSFPLTLSLSCSVTVVVALSLSFPLTLTLIPSRSIVVPASHSRRSVSASLSLSPSVVGSNYLTKVRTLFFLGLLVKDDWHAIT